MNQAIETIERGIYKLEIFQDEDPLSPDDWDNVGGRQFISRRHIENDARELIRKYGSFWYSEIQSQDREYRVYLLPKKEWTKEGNPRSTGQAYADAMATQWEQYCNGEVYGYVISVKTSGTCECEEWEEVDSCWGFYGDDHCMEEAKGMLSHFVAKEEEGKAFEAFGMAL